jgi:hypothetical protein
VAAASCGEFLDLTKPSNGSCRGLMEYQIKILRGLDRGNYVIMFIRGSMDIAAFRRVLDKLVEATQSFLDCKILIDFQDCKCQFLPSDVAQIALTFDFTAWPHSNKIALVSSPDKEQYRHLVILSDCLIDLKIDVSVFDEMRDAISWLARGG